MTIYYCDPTAASDGSGTSSSPWKTFYGKALGSGDSVWLRRAGFVLIPNNWTAPAFVGFFGYPKAGDDIQWGNDGASLPPGDPGGWASDPGDYAEIRGAADVIITIAPCLNFPTGGGNTLLTYFRIKFNQPNLISGPNSFVTLSAAGGYISDCLFTGLPGSGAYVVQCFQGNDASFRNCKFEVTGSLGTGLHVYPDAFGTGNGPSLLFDRCTFTEDAAHLGNPLIIIELYDFTKIGFCGCAFTGLGDCPLLTCGTDVFGDTLGMEEMVSLNDCTFDDTGRAATSFGDCIQATKLVGSNVQVNTKTGVTVGTPSNASQMPSQAPSWIKFSKFTQTAARPHAIKVQGATSRIQVDNFSPHGSTTTPIAADAGSRVELVNAAAPSLRRQNVYIKDEAGVVDAWHRIALQGDVRKSSVARTGGESFSAKFTYDQDVAAKRPLFYGEPGDELISRYVPAGNRTLTLYGAYKGYATSLLPRDVWLEVEYFDNPSTPHRALASSRGSAILSDASTWTGDSGLTMFKVQVSFTQQQSRTCPMRLCFRHYDVGAVTYLDPLIEVS